MMKCFFTKQMMVDKKDTTDNVILFFEDIKRSKSKDDKRQEMMRLQHNKVYVQLYLNN